MAKHIADMNTKELRGLSQAPYVCWRWELLIEKYGTVAKAWKALVDAERRGEEVQIKRYDSWGISCAESLSAPMLWIGALSFLCRGNSRHSRVARREARLLAKQYIGGFNPATDSHWERLLGAMKRRHPRKYLRFIANPFGILDTAKSVSVSRGNA